MTQRCVTATEANPMDDAQYLEGVVRCRQQIIRCCEALQRRPLRDIAHEDAFLEADGAKPDAR